ncbi:MULTISPECIES: hypothetical protein [Bacteria]|uniref:hypothetical protein n=1 Tax=Bacteria TaxID=2 RepID=UPI0007D828B6
MIIIDMLRSDGSIVVNKNLVHAIGLNAAVLYSELISKHAYFENREMLTKDGYFYNRVDNIRLDTGLGEKPQSAAIKQLKKLGLIKTDKRGLPATRYFKVVDNDQLIADILSSGKQKRLELEKELDLKNQKKKEAYNSHINSYAQMEELVQPDGRINNTKENNTKNNLKDREQNSVIARYSFSDYKNSLNIQELMPYQKEQLEALIVFVNGHEEHMEKEHPKLTMAQWNKALDAMLYVANAIGNDNDLTVSDEEEMINSYFQTEFKQGCNYSVLHYISGDLRSVRFYDAVY